MSPIRSLSLRMIGFAAGHSFFLCSGVPVLSNGASVPVCSKDWNPFHVLVVSLLHSVIGLQEFPLQNFVDPTANRYKTNTAINHKLSRPYLDMADDVPITSRPFWNDYNEVDDR
jgi:hypothetical protein